MRWSNRLQLALAGAAGVGTAWLMAGAVAQLRPGAASPAQKSPTPSASVLHSAEASQHAAAEFVVMIDPSHGGDDKGAMLEDGKLAEKDVSLALARELRRQLEDRGVAARLLRDSDVPVSLERRAIMTNEERAAIYIALHAGQPGRGIRVYEPALTLAPSPPLGRFLPWDTAQAGSLERSRVLARMVASELRKVGLPVASLAAPLRPLNNLVTPAIAVEWVPGPEDLRPPHVQRLGNALAMAIASGIVQAHAQGSERRGAERP